MADRGDWGEGGRDHVAEGCHPIMGALCRRRGEFSISWSSFVIDVALTGYV